MCERHHSRLISLLVVGHKKVIQHELGWQCHVTHALRELNSMHCFSYDRSTLQYGTTYMHCCVGVVRLYIMR
jgi:hypothetical protein